MTSRRWFILIFLLFGVAFAASALLYVRSRSADLDAHARAVETLGRVRHLDRRLSTQVLEARFGLLNQYDPINETEADLNRAASELDGRLAEVVPVDGDLEGALRAFGAAVGERTSAVEHFKGENSILKNSLRYLPTAADEVNRALAASAEGRTRSAEATRVIHGLVRAALVYNLIGDQSTRDAHLEAVKTLDGALAHVPAELASEFGLLVSHARVISDRQPTVDAWLRRASSADIESRLVEVQRLYEARFSQAAAVANGYRKVLYGWSVCLVVLVALAGVWLSRLYAGLELRVKERTAELRRALDALWGEMKLARKIQEALVPAAPELEGCDVAVTMKAADEVGGDYYDVIRAGQHEWILIGDVSGHGVPAGLIMMMCQTSVRTALERDPELTPDRLLALVNEVLIRNIRQLGEDKYMTMTALRRDPDGTIRFAGAHQDIFVYRAASDEIETIETPGIWLGIFPAKESSFASGRLSLAAGDVLVLYTDGITEATRDGALFDTGGMLKALGGSKGKTAAQIQDSVLAALSSFELRDDATLLVIRQLGEPLPSTRPLVPDNARPVA
jgi:serine phosphatase RsbU (regulator of sigma subunit)